MNTHQLEAQARVEVRRVEAELRQRHEALQRVFALPPYLARLLDLLLVLPAVEPALLYRHSGVAAEVAVHRLRKALQLWDLDVRSRRRAGDRVGAYWLDNIDKMKVRAMLEV